MAYTINTGKEAAQTRRPIILCDFTFPDGSVLYAATVSVTYSGHVYEPFIESQDIAQLASLSEQGIDRVPSATIRIADPGAAVWTTWERAAGKGFKGATLTMRLVLLDVETGEFSTDALVPFLGLCDQPSLDEKYLTVTASSRLNLSRYALPTVPIQPRCPWINPATAAERVLAADASSRFYLCGETRDLVTAPPCSYNKQTCTQPARYGGSCFQVAKSGSGREYVSGNSVAWKNPDTSGKYNQFWPLWLGGKAWVEAIVLNQWADGNYTRGEAAVGVGSIQIDKVICNGVELDYSPGMTGDYRYHKVNDGSRDGAHNADVGYDNGDVYGNCTVIQFLAPHSVIDPNSQAQIRVLGKRLNLPYADPQPASLGGESTPWVLAEALRWARFTDADLNLDTFAAAAAIADASISYTDKDGVVQTQPRFSTAIAIKERRSAAEIVRGIRQSIGGLLVPGSDGKLQIKLEGPLAEQQAAPVDGSNDDTPVASKLRTAAVTNGYLAYRFNESNAKYLKRIARPASESPNRVAFPFVDPASDWAVSQFSLVDPDDAARMDQESPGGLQVQPEGITSQNHAYRCAKLGLAKIHRGNPAGDTRGTDWWEWQTSFRGCKLLIGQLVAIDDTRCGLSSQLIRLTEIKPSSNYETVTLRGHSHSDDWYLDAPSTTADSSGGSYAYEPPAASGQPPVVTIPATATAVLDGTDAVIRVAPTYPDPRGTLTHLHAHLQMPYVGEPGDTATNVPARHEDVDLGPFKLDPQIEIRWSAPAAQEVWGLWLSSSSDAIDRKWTDPDTPFCKVTVPAYVGALAGAEYAPNPAIASLSASWDRLVVQGGDQLWLGKLAWVLPDSDPRWAHVREWCIDIFNPALSDDPGTPDDERVLWSRRIPAYLNSLTLDWRRIEDGEPEYLLLVRPVDEQGRVNSYVPGVTAAIAIRPRLVPRTAGTEYCALIDGFAQDGSSYYEQDRDTGAYVLRVPLKWPIPADARYGGAKLICHRGDGTVEDWPVVPVGSLPRPTDGAVRSTGARYGYFTATFRRLPIATEDLLFHALSVDANGQQNSYVYEVTPSVTVTVQPRAAAQRVANVTGFSVSAAYADPDSDGFRPLLLTPIFTGPSDPAFAYVDFWAYRPDSGKWHLLGYPSKGGVVDVATIYQTPASDGNWVFKAIAHDVNGKDRDGKVNSDPAAPPDGTPSFTLHIDPLAAETAGAEWTDNVTGFAGGATAGAAIEYRTTADGVEQWRACLTWTRPGDKRFGGIKPVVRFDPSGTPRDVPLGYTGPDEPLPWRSGWFDMGATATAEIYAVGVSVAGQRENTLVPGTTPRIAGLTIEPQTDGSMVAGRVDTDSTTLKVKKADGTVFLEIGKIPKEGGGYHYGLKAVEGTFSVVIDPDLGVVITDTAANAKATLTQGQLYIIEDSETVFSDYASYKKDGWSVSYTPQSDPVANQEQVIEVAADASVLPFGDRLVLWLSHGDLFFFDTLGRGRLKSLDLVDGLTIGDVQVVGAQQADPGTASVSVAHDLTGVAGTAGAAYTAVEQSLINFLVGAVTKLNAEVFALRTQHENMLTDRDRLRTVLQNHGLMA